MNHKPTVRTGMNPDTKGLGNINSTITTYLGSARGIHRDDCATNILSFVAQHLDEFIPTGIVNGFSEMMIVNHAIDIELFDSNKTVAVNESPAELMQEVDTLVTDSFMHPCNTDTSISMIITAFDFPRQSTLKTMKSLFRFNKTFGVLNMTSIGEAGEPLQADINTNLFVSMWVFDSSILTISIFNGEASIPDMSLP